MNWLKQNWHKLVAVAVLLCLLCWYRNHQQDRIEQAINLTVVPDIYTELVAVYLIE